MTQDIWKDHFDQGTVEDIIKDMRVIVTLADKQCFGMVRKSVTAEIRERLKVIRRKVDNFDNSLPREELQIDIEEKSVASTPFIKGIVKLLEANKHERRS